MPVVRQWLWLVADEPIAHRQRLLFQELQLGFHRRIEVEKRGSVAIPTEAFIAAGSSAALGIIFCCCVGFLSSASQAVAVRQILSSVAMV